MLLVDDLLLAPIHGLLWVFGKIHEAVQEEIAGEADSITAELSQLYMMLETGRITEAEFDAQERVLLDRLEAIRTNVSVSDGEDVGEQDDEDDGDNEDGGDDEDEEGEAE
jgi:hypothetical protein